MRRKKLKNQKRILIITTCSLLLFLTIGYAAFSTTISLNAKGNIKDYNAAFQLKNNVVTTGNGLYADATEPNRYIYKGQNPNNYITFNNELWRIISVENDDTLKIISNASIGSMSWDSEPNRNNDNNTYCKRETTFGGITKYWGCNVWNLRSDTYTDGKNSGTVTANASLNDYLNNEYYNSLNDDKNYIQNHIFNIGRADSVNSSNDDLTIITPISTIYQEEKEDTWNGNVGLVNVSDFLKASNNPSCDSPENSRTAAAPCSFENGNWLDELKEETWTINAYRINDTTLKASETTSIRTVSYYSGEGLIKGGVSGYYSITTYLVRPVVYLKSDIKLEGKGTKEEPYQIKK